MNTTGQKPFYLVGHRGFPAVYPENTMAGILAAIAEGADGVEFDIQISKDNIPVVFHDASLARTTGIDGELADYTFSVLERLSAHEPERFGLTHLPEPITSLANLVKELAKWPEVVAFAEIKQEIFARQNREKTMLSIGTILQPIKSHCYVISFDWEILQLASHQGFQIGWVLETLDDDALEQARLLNPAMLIIDYAKLPPQGPPQGPWQWFVYDIIDPALAQTAIDQGIRYIETWNIAGLKNHFAKL